MKFKDVAAFYLGCGVVYNGAKATLNAIHTRGFGDISGDGCDAQAVKLDELKPVLRPISSMTEEEKREYASLRFKPESRHIAFEQPITYSDSIGFTIKCHIAGATDYEFQFSMNNGEQILWLCRNSFDVFGLLPDQAIDKTTEER